MHSCRWQLRHNWVLLEAQWASSLVSPFSAGSKSSTMWSNSFCLSEFPGPVWSLLPRASLRTTWCNMFWLEIAFNVWLYLCAHSKEKALFKVCTLTRIFWNKCSDSHSYKHLKGQSGADIYRYVSHQLFNQMYWSPFNNSKLFLATINDCQPLSTSFAYLIVTLDL